MVTSPTWLFRIFNRRYFFVFYLSAFLYASPFVYAEEEFEEDVVPEIVEQTFNENIEISDEPLEESGCEECYENCQTLERFNFSPMVKTSSEEKENLSFLPLVISENLETNSFYRISSVAKESETGDLTVIWSEIYEFVASPGVEQGIQLVRPLDIETGIEIMSPGARAGFEGLTSSEMDFCDLTQFCLSNDRKVLYICKAIDACAIKDTMLSLRYIEIP